MKKSILSFLFLSFAFVFYGQTKEADIQVLPGYTAMVMDVAEYEDTIYEAMLALSDNNDQNQINIFINKYINAKYDSTISIDIPSEQFQTGEFRENSSHYEHLKIFPISKDEFCLTVYAAYSNCHFTFLRIKEGKILSKKTYNLLDSKSYESTNFAYNGNDTIYFTYNGQEVFKESNWDNWIIAFDLDGNVKNYVKLYTKYSDEISDMVAFPDYVYITQIFYKSESFYSVLKLSSDLKTIIDVIPYKYGNGSPRYVEFYKNTNKLVLNYGITDFDGNSQSYISEFSPEGNFETSYNIKSLKEMNDTDVYMGTPQYKKDGIYVSGYKTIWEDIFFSKENPVNYDLSKYVDYEFKEGYIYSYSSKYKSSNRIYTDGKLFVSGSYNYKNAGISKIAYHMVLKDKTKTDIPPYEYIKSDLNPFEKNEITAAKSKEVRDAVKIEKYKIKQEESLAQANIIKLSWISALPDEEKVISTIPVLPFSER